MDDKVFFYWPGGLFLLGILGVRMVSRASRVVLMIGFCLFTLCPIFIFSELLDDLVGTCLFMT